MVPTSQGYCEEYMSKYKKSTHDTNLYWSYMQLLL